MDRREKKKKREKKRKRDVFPLSWTYPMEDIEKVSSYTAPPPSLPPSLPHPVGMRRGVSHGCKGSRRHDGAREEKPRCWTKNIGHVSPQLRPLIRRLGHVRGHVGPREDILHRNHHQLGGAPSYDVRASWNRNAFFSFTLTAAAFSSVQACLCSFSRWKEREEAVVRSFSCEGLYKERCIHGCGNFEANIGRSILLSPSLEFACFYRYWNGRFFRELIVSQVYGILYTIYNTIWNRICFAFLSLDAKSNWNEGKGGEGIIIFRLRESHIPPPPDYGFVIGLCRKIWSY